MTYAGKHPQVYRVSQTYATRVCRSTKEMKRLEQCLQRLPGLEKWSVIIPPPKPDELFSMTRHRARISAPARVTSWLVCPLDGSQCRREIRTMPYIWPADTDCALWELAVLDRNCPTCGRMMHVCDHRPRRFHTLQGPVELTCRLDHCPDPDCPGHTKTKSPELEVTLALPKWAIGWDV